MRSVCILVIVLSLAAVAWADMRTDEGNASQQKTKTPKSVFELHHKLRALVFNSILSLQPVRHFSNIWKWARSVFGFVDVPLTDQHPALRNTKRAPPSSSGLSAFFGAMFSSAPKICFGAMVAKSVLSWFISPLAIYFGQSGVIETIAMFFGFVQAYVTENLKGFAEQNAILHSSNEQLQDKVVDFQSENDLLKESNSRLDRQLNQLEQVRGHLQEILLMGEGTAEGVEAAVNRIELKSDETIQVLNSQKKSFEEQKESFERQAKVCDEERKTCEQMKKVCEDEREIEDQEVQNMWIPLAS